MPGCTVTMKSCETVNLSESPACLSAAVTVIVAEPADSAASVSVLSLLLTLAVATPTGGEVAAV